MTSAPKRRLPGASSLAVMAVLVLGWVAVSLLAPDAMARMVPDPRLHPASEGPIDAVENVVLVIVIGLWFSVAVRHRASRSRAVLATLMALQFVFILGEETDWGQNLGLRPPADWRNVRMVLRDMGILQRWNDAIFPTAYLLFFTLVPLVPIGAVQRWLERVAPVRAERGDGIAIVLTPFTWAGISALVVEQSSVELAQVCVYGVTLNLVLRILRAPVPSGP